MDKREERVFIIISYDLGTYGKERIGMQVIHTYNDQLSPFLQYSRYFFIK